MFLINITPEDLDWFERRIGPLLPSCDDLGIPPRGDVVVLSLEGAGKRRIFAVTILTKGY